MKIQPSAWNTSLNEIWKPCWVIMPLMMLPPTCGSPWPSCPIATWLIGLYGVMCSASCSWWLTAPRVHIRVDRSGEAAAERAQEGRQARAGGDLVLLQVRQQDRQRRHEEQRHAQTLQQLHHGDVVEVDLQIEVRAHETGRAHHQERRRREQAQVHAGGVLAH